MKLYEIAQSIREFINSCEEGIIPIDAMEDTLAGLDMELNEKADNLASIIKELKAETEAIKTEEQMLYERRKAKENRSKWLEEYLQSALLLNGITRVETARNFITFRKSTSVHIENEEDFKQRYANLCKRETKVDIIKKEVSNALKSGVDLIGASLITKENIQIK